MKEIKNKDKKSFLKNIFIKICRFLGFEIIDQSKAYIPTMGISINENTNILGKKSINLPLGEVKISRKVKSLDIIIRTCMEVQMLTQNKKRVFEKHKSEYSLRTVNSIIQSYKHSKNLKNLEVKFTVIDHNSEKENLSRLHDLFRKNNLKFKLINLEISNFKNAINKINEKKLTVTDNQISNMSNIHQSLIEAKNCNDLVYFIEDDYLHSLDCLEEMIFAYERISSQLDKEIFMLPADYPYLYSKFENTVILLGKKYHWRKVNESLCSMLTSKKMIEKYWLQLKGMCEFEHYPFEKPLHKIFEKEFCFSPIPSLSFHCTNINSIFGLSPNIDWKKIWDENKIN